VISSPGALGLKAGADGAITYQICYEIGNCFFADRRKAIAAIASSRQITPALHMPSETASATCAFLLTRLAAEDI
jgi:hypothetical protein